MRLRTLGYAACALLIIGLSIIVGGGYILTKAKGSRANLSTVQRDLRTELSAVQNDKNMQREQKLQVSADIFENYWPRLKPENVLATLETFPECHVLSHWVGKRLIVDGIDINAATDLCRSRCTLGCFHGILAGIFDVEAAQAPPQDDTASDINAQPADTHASWMANVTRGPRGHIDFKTVVARAQTACERFAAKGQIIEECAHGMGHVFMQSKENKVPVALPGCMGFPDTASRYHCAGGVFMENAFVTHAPKDQAQFYDLCESAMPFPEAIPACYRYRIHQIIVEHDRSILPDTLAYCTTLQEGLQRRACLHGYGFVQRIVVADSPKLLWPICSTGTLNDQKMCFDGALMALAGLLQDKYVTARQDICAKEFAGPPELRTYCVETVRDGFYGGKHDYSLYEQ